MSSLPIMSAAISAGPPAIDLNTLAEHLHNGLWAINKDGIIRYVNPRMAKLLEFDPEELIGQPFPALVAPIDLPIVLSMLDTGRSAHIPHSDVRLHKRSGEILWMMVCVTKLATPEQDIHVFLTMADITERKLNELALREKSAQIEAIYNSSSTGIFLADKHGLLQHANPTFEVLAGRLSHELTGENWLQSVHPEDRARVALEWRMSVKQQLPCISQFRMYLPGHEIVWVRLISRAMIVDSRMHGFVASIEDITRSKLSEILEASEREVLEMLVQHRPLPEILGHICRQYEQRRPGEFCSVMLIDELNLTFKSCIGPSLPEVYRRLATGAPIEEQLGACGAAFWLKQRTISPNIAEDPRWEPIRTIVLGVGLHACWSTPVINRDGKVLATFAVYTSEPCHPSPEALTLVDHQAPLVLLAIERKQAQQQLDSALATLKSIADGVISVDQHLQVISLNPQAERMTGWYSKDAVGLYLDQVFTVIDEENGEPLITCPPPAGDWGRRESPQLASRHGFRIPIEYNTSPIIDTHQELEGWVVAFRDVSKTRLMARELSYQANHDYLTGLPNRMLMRDRLDLAIANASRSGDKLALLYLDLDHFKHVNDTLGHAIGDLLLKQVASRLISCVRESDTVSRQGGDEFVILLTNISGPSDIANVAEKIIKTLTEPMQLDSHTLTVQTSIGISMYPDDAMDSSSLARTADAALYFAKEQGRNNYQFFTYEMSIRAAERLATEQVLRAALDQSQFELCYQPQISMHTGQVSSVEALLRWRHPVRGLLHPAEFLPVAEDIGIMGELGDWVLRQACLQQKIWEKSGLPNTPIAINISPRQLRRFDFIRNINAIMQEMGLGAHSLQFELAENTIMVDGERRGGVLGALGQTGGDIVIDDFGTGYSNLGMLQRVPFYKLKVDISLIHDIGTNTDAEAVVKAMINLGKSLKLIVVAEGVETAEQWQFLLACGCDAAQGYYYCPPLSADEFEHWWRQHLREATS
ncbi:diguanylate cyclase (GGDEF)-like protein/PAS domain S-box-containing protein [Chitinivorax tropicus]|uniref:Diguanylate cyclase (GGDEF)-like protein/PAS domain S-box-containing protein n=1 Tax=Chitinivorax tropicus TaxID=714531 RepID=A0A840MRS5_9PROT|nr:EAL domain-containing protein [Chitinivorax tropicus]MBB5017921.1 diguanylate cyclase (GGDEF)-like protein/PAS domain S-box-containing protein [Chitinivorax tropicus]